MNTRYARASKSRGANVVEAPGGAHYEVQGGSAILLRVVERTVDAPVDPSTTTTPSATPVVEPGDIVLYDVGNPAAEVGAVR